MWGLTVLVYGILTCAFALLSVTFLDWREYQHLAKTGIRTIGRVTSKEPENHNFVRYSFIVGPETFFGYGNAGGENKEFEQLSVGSPITIYYDPENPSFSFLGSPIRQAESATRGVIFMTVAGSLLSMVGLCAKGWLPICNREKGQS